MALRSFLSFDELREGMVPDAVPGERAREVLRVAAELHAGDGPAVARACRASLLDWLGDRMPGPLPPEAAGSGNFSVRSGRYFLEGARVRRDGDEVRALRLAEPVGKGPRSFRVTELGLREAAGRFPEFRLRLLADVRGPSPDTGPRVPDIVGKLASVFDMRCGNRRISTDPLLVDSEPAAKRLAEELLSPQRSLPYLALSVPENAEDPTRPLLDPVAMSRATAGLAVVVVVPHEATWALTRIFGDRRLSVYLGAARLYLPGFRLDGDPREHRLILGDWMEKPGGLASSRDDLLRQIARRSVTGDGEWTFARLRTLAREEREESGAAVESDSTPDLESPPESFVSVSAAAPAAEKASGEGPTAAAESPVVPDSPDAPPASEARPAPADAPDEETAEVAAAPAQEVVAGRETGPPATGGDAGVSPAASAPPLADPETPAPEAPAAPPRSTPWWRRVVLALRGLPDPAVDARHAAERDAWLRELEEARERLRRVEERADRSETKLGRLEEEKDELEGEWEDAERRVDAALQERDLAVREVQELLELLDARGLSPPASDELPETWAAFGAWCERELTGRVRLMPRARREIKRARFADVRLAARCLRWLGGEYRRLRLETSGLGLRGRVENGVHNQQCGGDAFPVKWRGKHQKVDWHIKSGGSTHDPTRCLRIYYFWDPASDEVVIASMPAHIRTDAT